MLPLKLCPAALGLILMLVFSPHPRAADTVVPEGEARELLAAIEKELGKTRTLRTRFVQEKHLAMFARPLTADGVIYFSRPRRVRFELAAPFRSVLIVNGDKVAKYEHGADGWARLNLPNTDAMGLVMDQIAAWMRGDFDSQSRLFELAVVKRDGNVLVQLTPKHKRFGKIIQRIELKLAPARDRFVSVTIREPDGDYTLLRFTEETRGVDLA